ncbi:MAG: sigma-54-dependent Fis family transcriptional regulator [Verrucomicrobiaceae bacterium]|nr:sigma-54-dependent Fis family transcriptional regulator [Verrucomicrobiaceae bacterium]
MDILIIDDEKIIRDSVSQLLEDAGHYTESASSRATALQTLAEAEFQLVLLDVALGGDNGLEVLVEIQKRHPGLPVVIFTAAATIQTAVEAMRLGALDFLEKPFNRQQLAIVLSRIQKHHKLVERVTDLQQQVATQSPEAVFESASHEVRAIYDVLFRAAATSATILILGESGTGKTVAARAVHHASTRAEKAFITVNSPGLSKELIESELFGHVKGAFTGAVKDHWGKVKAADGGTLFLDEIGELPLDLQAKLLRLLQDREYERVGETTTRKADVRVIAATNRDLKKAVQDGTFREDLYYRLNVITVEMPPLRRRPDDLIQFAENYVKFFGRQFGRSLRGFSAEARKRILSHSWPGNLRELRNAIERAVILTPGREIGVTDLPLGDSAPATHAFNESLPGIGDAISLEALETAHIKALLEKLPNLADVARVLGIDQATLYRKRKKLGL